MKTPRAPWCTLPEARKTAWWLLPSSTESNKVPESPRLLLQYTNSLLSNILIAPQTSQKKLERFQAWWPWVSNNSQQINQSTFTSHQWLTSHSTSHPTSTTKWECPLRGCHLIRPWTDNNHSFTIKINFNNHRHSFMRHPSNIISNTTMGSCKAITLTNRSTRKAPKGKEWAMCRTSMKDSLSTFWTMTTSSTAPTGKITKDCKILNRELSLESHKHLLWKTESAWLQWCIPIRKWRTPQGSAKPVWAQEPTSSNRTQEFQ